MTPILRLAALSLLGLAAGCAHLAEPAQDKPVGQVAWVVTDDMQLKRFDLGQPGRILDARPLAGLPAGERIVGIDYRVARGVMYALGREGGLYTVDTRSATATRVSATPLAVPLQGERFGMDFNPTVMLVRVVSDTGQNLRLHPDTGAVVDGDAKAEGVQPDPGLAFDAADAHAGIKPQVAAAGYTYNKVNDKITTNYAIELGQGLLVTQGTKEGVTPAVPPNSGRLFTVGSLGLGPLADASLDLRDTDNAAWAVLQTRTDGRARLYRIDLVSGRATLVGTVGDGRAVQGFAIEP